MNTLDGEEEPGFLWLWNVEGKMARYKYQPLHAHPNTCVGIYTLEGKDGNDNGGSSIRQSRQKGRG